MAGQGASEVKAEPQASDRPRGETGDIVGPGSRQKRRWPLAHHPKPRHLSASKLSAFRLFASSRKSLNSSASSAVGSSTIGAAVSGLHEALDRPERLILQLISNSRVCALLHVR